MVLLVMKAALSPQGNSFLVKRKLIRFLVWSRKVYETLNKEQGVLLP